MKFIKILLFLLFVNISSANNSELPKQIIDKKSFKVYESNIYTFVKGSEVEYKNSDFKYVYYIYYNDYTHIKVSKELYNTVNISNIKL